MAVFSQIALDEFMNEAENMIRQFLSVISVAFPVRPRVTRRQPKNPFHVVKSLLYTDFPELNTSFACVLHGQKQLRSPDLHARQFSANCGRHAHVQALTRVGNSSHGGN